MNSLKENSSKAHILIIGSGVIGKFNAIELSRLGYKITIADPNEDTNSSNASLGILMGKIYQKRKGRSWLLRKKSLELWPNWVDFLRKYNSAINIEKPLIQLTTKLDEFEKIKKFVQDNSKDNLKILEENSRVLKNINQVFHKNNFRGVISYEDGRINPKQLLKALNNYLKEKNIKTIREEVIEIKSKNQHWIAKLKNGETINSEVIILCNSLKSQNLIDYKNLGIELMPVLGQAIEIYYDSKDINFLHLPKCFSINRKNLIPVEQNKIIIGSTDEYSNFPGKDNVDDLIKFLEIKPNWLTKENILKKWFGIRSRPKGEASPILRSLEKGLILCSGFYKNGIMLGPACANWVSQEIKKHI